MNRTVMGEIIPKGSKESGGKAHCVPFRWSGVLHEDANIRDVEDEMIASDFPSHTKDLSLYCFRVRVIAEASGHDS